MIPRLAYNDPNVKSVEGDHHGSSFGKAAAAKSKGPEEARHGRIRVTSRNARTCRGRIFLLAESQLHCMGEK